MCRWIADRVISSPNKRTIRPSPHRLSFSFIGTVCFLKWSFRVIKRSFILRLATFGAEPSCFRKLSAALRIPTARQRGLRWVGRWAEVEEIAELGARGKQLGDELLRLRILVPALLGLLSECLLLEPLGPLREALQLGVLLGYEALDGELELLHPLAKRCSLSFSLLRRFGFL